MTGDMRIQTTYPTNYNPGRLYFFIKRGANMEEQIRNTAEKLKQLDAENVKLIDSGISLLIARQEIEKNKEKKEAVCS